MVKKKAKKILEVSSVDDLITQSEAAEISGRTLHAVNELVRRGRLRSELKYGRRLVYRSDVLAFEPEPGGRGRRAASSS